MRFRCLV